MGTYRLALTGDVILNTRPSLCPDPDVRAALDLLRGADVTHAHLEIPLAELDDPDVFGAAEGALSWMRGPTAIAEELRALGVDLVSAASNHSLDWSYGGLRSTVAALDAVGLPHAGIGADLAAARAPAFADTAVARVALVSATSSFPAFARAGAARVDARGRPGINPQRYLSVIDPPTAEQLMTIAGRLGQWVVRQDDEFVIHPPGLHNSIWRLRVDPAAGEPTTVCDPDDLAGNLESIRFARSVSDLVVAHLHVQAWDGTDGRMRSTPAFATQFAQRRRRGRCRGRARAGLARPDAGDRDPRRRPDPVRPRAAVPTRPPRRATPRLLPALGKRPGRALLRREPARRVPRPRPWRAGRAAPARGERARTGVRAAGVRG